MKFRNRVFTALLAFLMIFSCVLPGMVPQAKAAELTFSSFEQLEMLAQNTYAEYTIASYIGSADLTVKRDLTIPDNLDVWVGGVSVTIPQNVTLTLSGTNSQDGGLQADRLQVDGELRNYSYLYVYDALEVCGTLRNEYLLGVWYDYGGRMSVSAGTYVGTGDIAVFTEAAEYPADAISGLELNLFQIERVAEESPYFCLYPYKTFSSFRELQTLCEETYNSYLDAYYVGTGDLTIEAELTIPDNLNVVVDGAAVIVPKGITLHISGQISQDGGMVAQNLQVKGRLNNGGSLYVSGELEVTGTLQNEYALGILYDLGGRVKLSGGAYTGKGVMFVITEKTQLPGDAVTGLDMSKFQTEEVQENIRFFTIFPKEETSSASVKRIYGEGRCETARKVADEMKVVRNIQKFDAILYTSGMSFADALAGSFLSARKNAPLLLYLGNKTDPQANLDYIKANLSENGIVYILGGESAVPKTVEEDLQANSIRFERVAGAHRYATNLEILKAGGFDGGTVLVCTGLTFADSLSASATGLPILLVAPTAKELTKDAKAFLAPYGSKCNFVLVGGTNAVSGELEESLRIQYGADRVERLAGGTRYETSTMVAEKFFGTPEEIVLAYALTFPDGLCGGALAYAKQAPLILTYPGYTQKAQEYVSAKGIKTGTVLGGPGLVDDASVNAIFGK